MITASDGKGGSVTTTIDFAISNLPPVAAADTGDVPEDGPAASGNVLDNDHDTAPDSDPLSVSSAVQGVNPITIGVPFTVSGGGVLTLNSNGSYSFDPGTAYNGLAEGDTATEVIGYTVSDGNGGTTTQTLTLTITGSNDGPVVIDPSDPGTPDNPKPASDPANIIPDVTATDGATPATIDVTDYIVDPDGEPLTFSATGLPPGLTLDPDTGIISGTITHDASQGGPYHVVITATDPHGSSITTTLDYAISNIAPVAVDDSSSADEDTGQSGNVLTDAVTGDHDGAPDSDPLTVTLANGQPVSPGSPAILNLPHGTLTLASDGSWSFTPSAAANALAVGVSATDTVSYTVSDGNGGTAVATLSLHVAGVNDVPVAVQPLPPADDFEGDDISLDVSGFFDDVDASDVLSFSATGLPPGLSIDPHTGVISGTITLGSSVDGPYLVTVTVNDGHGGTLSQSFEWEVKMPPTPGDTPPPGPQPRPPLFTPQLQSQQHVISDTVDGLAPLNGTPILTDYVITRTVQGLSDLNSATQPGPVDDVITQLVAWAGRQGHSAQWIHLLLNELEHTPYAGDEIDLALSLGDGNALAIRTLLKDGALFVSVDELVPGISVTAITGPGGTGLPEFAAPVGRQAVVINVRPDGSVIPLEIHGRDIKGRAASWQIKINPTSAEVLPAGSQAAEIDGIISAMRAQLAEHKAPRGPNRFTFT